MRGNISRMTAIILIAGMLFSMTGCNYNKETAANTQKSEDTSQTYISAEEFAERLKRADEEKKAEETDGIAEDKETASAISVYVNSSGYDIKSDKKFIISDDNSENDYNFKIINAEDESIVCTGKTSGSESVFTQFDSEGSYYIQIDNIGISEEFVIEKNHYFNMANRIMNNQSEIMENSDFVKTETEDVLIAISDLILSYTFFKEDTLDKAYEEIRKIYMETDETGTLDKKYSASDMYMYSAVSAMFADAYKDKDPEYASKMLKSSINTYEFAAEKKQEVKEDIRYWAAAELYLCTADKKYRDAAETILSECNEIPIGFSKEACGYYGSLAYIMTTNKTDVDIAGKVMNSIIDDAIRISTGEITGSAEDLVSEARLMIVANSISKSVTYIRAAEERIDYLYGMNVRGINYMDENSGLSEKELIFVFYGFDNSHIGSN